MPLILTTEERQTRVERDRPPNKDLQRTDALRQGLPRIPLSLAAIRRATSGRVRPCGS
jgi:hypothetical protein